MSAPSASQPTSAPSAIRRKVADDAPGFMPLDEAQTLFEIAGEYLSQPDSTKLGIEIGTSFGSLHGRVWRIGTMGYNARKDAVLTTLAALEAVLRRFGAAVPAGGGVEAAVDIYAGAA